jgi:uncharacterized protein (UPF0332 family)
VSDRAWARLDQSATAIEGARRDLAANAYDLAADRAYYAMFYAADPLLARRGLSFSSHGAVHGAIGKEFAKTGDLDPKFHRWLLDAYDQRQAATYGISTDIAKDRAQEFVLQPEEFLAAARAYLAAGRP